MKKLHTSLMTTIAASLVAATTVFGAEIIYEPFDYAAAAMDGSTQNGGTGMSGAWTNNDGGDGPYTVLSPGLSVTDLPTTGNCCARSTYTGSAEMHRGISAASQSSLLADNTTIWFSVIVSNRPYSTGNEHQTLVLGTDPFTGWSDAPPSMTGGEGFGVGYNTQFALKGVAIDGGTASYSAGSIVAGNDTNHLIAGKITWAPNGSSDTLLLFNITDPLSDAPADNTAFATNTADLDQSLFDTLAVASKQRSALDEIRFALDFAGVMGREGGPFVELLASTVASNAPLGTSVGTLSMVNTNSAGFAYTLKSGGDNEYFDISASSTNLRTAKWLDSDSYDISVIGTKAAESFTNDYTISVSAAETLFVVSAQVLAPVTNGALIGTAQSTTAGTTFSIVDGRTDLFSFDGDDLKAASAADWGALGSTNYVTLRATTGAETTDLIVGVEVVSGITAGTLFLFQ